MHWLMLQLLREAKRKTVNQKPPYLIVISAPSGTGKTTLCQKLLQDFPSLTLSISSTTRPARGTEKHAVEYLFLEKKEFEKLIQQNRFAEWAYVHGNYYGTSKETIETAFAVGKSVLLDIDVQGAENLHRCYPDQCFRIFITPPNLQELEARLKARATDSNETIQKRLINATREMKEGEKFDSIIVNDSLERAYSELKALIETQLHLPSNQEKNA